MTYHASCMQRDTSHDIKAVDQIPHPYAWGSNSPPPGRLKWSNARGMPRGDVEASIWMVHNPLMCSNLGITAHSEQIYQNGMRNISRHLSPPSPHSSTLIGCVPYHTECLLCMALLFCGVMIFFSFCSGPCI